MEAALQVVTPEIRWHYGPTGLNESILSLDILPAPAYGDNAGKHKIIATAGADKEVKIWTVDAKQSLESTEKIHIVDKIKFIFSLSGHDRSVNCVRFSPDGKLLASASDDATVIIWGRAKSDSLDWNWDLILSFADVSRQVLACGHNGDVTDICWSPDSSFLCTTSIDNTCVIWDVKKACVIERKKDHTQFVQGAAWDPLNEFIVTEGNDRTCRVYSIWGFHSKSLTDTKKAKRKCICTQTIKTRCLEVVYNVAGVEEAKSADAVDTQTMRFRMFLDDTCPAFSRRLAWTPDGAYLMTPTAMMHNEKSDEHTNTVYGFARGNLNEAAVCLPGHEKASVCVRCVPRLFRLRDLPSKAVNNFFGADHRTVFAVLTLDSVYIYDTQQSHPIYIVKDIHYADLTDASWSTDAQMLIVSSTDGYVTLIEFDKDHFGEQLKPIEQQEVLGTLSQRVLMHANSSTRKRVRTPEKRTRVAQTVKKGKLLSPLMAAFTNRNEAKTDSTQVASTAPHMVQVRKAKDTCEHSSASVHE